MGAGEDSAPQGLCPSIAISSLGKAVLFLQPVPSTAAGSFRPSASPLPCPFPAVAGGFLQLECEVKLCFPSLLSINIRLPLSSADNC